jgi:hypothetical protein
MPFPAQYQTALGSGSTSTSNAYFVAGFRLLTVSIQSGATQQTNAANCIIQGSNADGMRSADLGGPTSSLGWSNLTIVLPGSLNAGGNVGSGVFTFDPPGYRWVRSFVSSTEHSVSSCWTVIFTGTRFGG